MGRIVQRIYVDRAPADVFAFVTDVSKAPAWDETTIEASASETPLRPGTVVRAKRTLMGRAVETVGQVTEFTPPTRFGTRSEKPYRYTIQWTFEPERGGTSVTRDGNLETTGILALLSPITRRVAARADQRSLERMKAAPEARAR